MTYKYLLYIPPRLFLFSSRLLPLIYPLNCLYPILLLVVSLLLHQPTSATMSTLRNLGHNGPLVNAVGLGTMSIAGAYGQQNTREEKLAFLDHAHSIGQRFWDTADIYFDSEAIIGEWFKRSGKRGDIFLATKFGLSYDASMQQSIRSDPEYVRMACERSLEKLGVETIDLYYCHRVDGVTPIEKTVEAMVQLKR